MQPTSNDARSWFLAYLEHNPGAEARFWFDCYARPTAKPAVVFRSMPFGTALFFDDGVVFLTNARFSGKASFVGQIGSAVLRELAVLPLDGIMELGGDLAAEAATSRSGGDPELEAALRNPNSMFMPYSAVTSFAGGGGAMAARGHRIVVHSGSDAMVLNHADSVGFGRPKKAILEFLAGRTGK